MGTNAYELLALAMRYVFAGLIVLIVARGWYGASVDSRRAANLRKLSPNTGIIGEMQVIDGGERAKSGMCYPVTLEGTIGSNRRADIRIRHSSVRRRHAIYQITEEGFFVRGHASLRVGDGTGHFARELMLHDGDHLQIGRVTLLLVLTDGIAHAPDAHRHRPRRRPGRNDGFPDDARPAADDADDLFRTNPAGGFGGYDEYDDF